MGAGCGGTQGGPKFRLTKQPRGGGTPGAMINRERPRSMTKSIPRSKRSADPVSGKVLLVELSAIAARRAQIHKKKAEIASELADLELQLASLEGETSRVFREIATGKVELHTAKKKRIPPAPPIKRLSNDDLTTKVARSLEKMHLRSST